MGMNFTVTVNADFRHEQDADDLISRYDVDGDMLGLSGDVSIEGVDVSGTVVIEGSLSVEDVEVPAVDLADFDANAALAEHQLYGSGSLDLSGVEFDITESPTGFEAAESATDRDTAIAVYAALAEAGFEVTEAS